MTTLAKNLIPSKVVENSTTTQYTASAVTATIGKLAVENQAVSAVTVRVMVVKPGDTNGTGRTKILQPGETYTFPEIVGQTMGPGGFISASATAAASVWINCSGWEIS